ncbi:keratin-associated protein 10-4-like [Onychostoma macrolepis]|uniref:keratin-associated protein 10-4-like n=1 Tax=Onychostoma macrolepis TaxID=369639 RepID=UPI00272D1946|nr:keratin-associated protein 10-4-like [Onychostoma macrolepis]
MAHTMSCEKSVNSCPVGCFAVTPVDDCKKVSCYVPICNNPCNHVPPCCDYGFNSNCKKVACCVKPCTKSYHCIPSACDSRCKGDCKKVACCVPVCSNPCNPVPLYCDNVCKDNCKVACYIKPCSESYNCIPSCCDYGCNDNFKKVAYCVPVCSNPCNPVPSCWDYGCKDECKKVACNNPCSNPCNYTPPYNDCKPVAFKDIKDDCKDDLKCPQIGVSSEDGEVHSSILEMVVALMESSTLMFGADTAAARLSHTRSPALVQDCVIQSDCSNEGGDGQQGQVKVDTEVSCIIRIKLQNWTTCVEMAVGFGFTASHTMSFEKSVNSCPVGCFAVTPVDDCKKVPCSVPVCNNPCSHVPPCCDYGCESNCKKVACCVKPCTKSYHCIPSGCDSGCKVDCKKVACYIKPCFESYNCIPSCCDYGCKDDCKKVAYCVPVCSNPCNPVPSCWDYGCKDAC